MPNDSGYFVVAEPTKPKRVLSRFSAPTKMCGKWPAPKGPRPIGFDFFEEHFARLPDLR